MHLLVHILKEKANEWKRETDCDPVLSQLKEVVLSGWPENRIELAPELRQYGNFRDELCISDGLLMKEVVLSGPLVCAVRCLTRSIAAISEVRNVSTEPEKLSIGLDYASRAKREWPSVKFETSTKTAKSKSLCYPFWYLIDREKS